MAEISYGLEGTVARKEEKWVFGDLGA